jgi:hypothetical protein
MSVGMPAPEELERKIAHFVRVGRNDGLEPARRVLLARAVDDLPVARLRAVGRLGQLRLERRGALLGGGLERGHVLHALLDRREIGVHARDRLALLAVAGKVDHAGLLVGALLERLERLAVLVGDVLEVVDVRHVRSLL